MWSRDLAYVVGLITTDGSLSKDGRHIVFVSKDLEQIETLTKILNLNNKIGKRKSSYNLEPIYHYIQFGNVKFYRFLLSIGLMPNKTKIIGSLTIPDKYFADFLRGHLDGDGYTYSYWDKRWKSSFMLYTGFISASQLHIEWLQERINLLYGIEGKIKYAGKSVLHLVFAKKASCLLLEKMYYSDDIPYLSRKRFKINKALGIIVQRRGVGMVDKHA